MRITRNPEVVKGCQFLGNVKESFSSSKGWGVLAAAPENTLWKKTAALGGNTLFIVSSSEYRALGEAYNCSGVDPNQPVPDQAKEEK